jgi:peptidoglycan/LPS O-acetylase OafA/YrhL
MQRSAPLDVLRAIAVLLVLFRHSTFNNLLQQIGWVGVDLFFVLSGYLVAALVFREFIDTGKFEHKIFFIRRGFKIYPAFYLFLIISILINYLHHGISYSPSLILAEVFFLQSYVAHIWTHTWSIAVEEHFYLMITLCGMIWLRRGVKINPGKLIKWLLSLLLLLLTIRFFTCLGKKNQDAFTFFATHLRMDGIVVGVIIAVLRYFHSSWQKIMKMGYWLLITALFFIWIPFVLKPDGFNMNTWGLTLMNIGFGLVLMFVLSLSSRIGKDEKPRLITTLFVLIGVHSYSIYLWHLLLLQEVQSIPVDKDFRNVIYLALSLLIGMGMSFAVERPALKMRDVFFPKALPSAPKI